LSSPPTKSHHSRDDPKISEAYAFMDPALAKILEAQNAWNA
jgi:hypothetical protein